MKLIVLMFEIETVFPLILLFQRKQHKLLLIKEKHTTCLLWVYDYESKQGV